MAPALLNRVSFAGAGAVSYRAWHPRASAGVRGRPRSRRLEFLNTETQYVDVGAVFGEVLKPPEEDLWQLCAGAVLRSFEQVATKRSELKWVGLKL